MRTENARRWIVAVTFLVGVIALSFTLRLEPGDDLFFAATFVLALLWAGGAVLAGARYRRGRFGARWSLALGIASGATLLAASLAAALVVARIPALAEPADTLLDHASGGAFVPIFVLAAVNGIAEELFFRGALYDALPTRLAIPVTTAAYTLTTVGTGVALLVLAAACLGALTAVLRRHTGELLAPTAAHLTWSLGMLVLLPTALATGS